MKSIDVFSCLGCHAIGFERAGIETTAFCEINPFRRAELAKRFPGKKIYWLGDHGGYVKSLYEKSALEDLLWNLADAAMSVTHHDIPRKKKRPALVKRRAKINSERFFQCPTARHALRRQAPAHQFKYFLFHFL